MGIGKLRVRYLPLHWDSDKPIKCRAVLHHVNFFMQTFAHCYLSWGWIIMALIGWFVGRYVGRTKNWTPGIIFIAATIIMGAVSLVFK